VAAGATITAGGTAVVVSGGTAATVAVPASYAAIATAAAGGAAKADWVLQQLDKKYSGTDHLIVQVDGKQVVPSSGTYRNIEGGETLYTAIQVSFRGSARISIIEYDWGSDNDDLGGLDVTGGWTHHNDRAVIRARHAEDGSIYFVSYSVQAGKGDPNAVVWWMMCGTNQCKACKSPKCWRDSKGSLDRDKDKGDLKRCPPGFRHHSWKKYDQIWPAADVYLNVCQRP